MKSGNTSAKPAKWIEIRYKCSCMKEEKSIHVQERETLEDILEFMERVRVALKHHHTQHSPMCQATKTEYIEIPILSGASIGKVEGGTA